jgi:hypothetical protein
VGEEGDRSLSKRKRTVGKTVISSRVKMSRIGLTDRLQATKTGAESGDTGAVTLSKCARSEVATDGGVG